MWCSQGSSYWMSIGFLKLSSLIVPDTFVWPILREKTIYESPPILSESSQEGKWPVSSQYSAYCEAHVFHMKVDLFPDQTVGREPDSRELLWIHLHTHLEWALACSSSVWNHNAKKLLTFEGSMVPDMSLENANLSPYLNWAKHLHCWLTGLVNEENCSTDRRNCSTS